MTRARVPQSAAVVLVRPGECPDGVLPEVLALRQATRGGLFGVPGGKIERGETPLQCAVRELREETGLEARALVEIVRAPAGPHLCVGFLGIAHGVPRSSREGRPVWVAAHLLLEAHWAAFPAWNRRALRAAAARLEPGLATTLRNLTR